MTTPTPVETLARLKLLEHALKAALQEAAEAAEAWRRENRARQIETDYGLVVSAKRRPTIQVDDAALLAWAEEHAPHAITRTITTPAKRALYAAWSVEGDDVIDATTGEIIPFAWVKPGGTSLLVRLDEHAKLDATDALHGRAAELGEGFARLLAAMPQQIEQEEAQV